MEFMLPIAELIVLCPTCRRSLTPGRMVWACGRCGLHFPLEHVAGVRRAAISQAIAQAWDDEPAEIAKVASKLLMYAAYRLQANLFLDLSNPVEELDDEFAIAVVRGAKSSQVKERLQGLTPELTDGDGAADV